jgi:dihydrolipoamide dehydrogenase
MKDRNYDLIVIGSGPGGYVAAIRAAQLNLKTAIVEKEKLGGVCLNWGCIPSKALLKNAQIYNQIREADSWGISTGEVHFDIEQIINRSRQVSDDISKGVAFLMKKNKIDVIQGSARFKSDRMISVTKGDESEEEYTAQRFIIATGARARSIPGLDIDGVQVITARHALELRRIPKSIVIIGGGAIGCEFGYFYNSFGSDVTIVEMLDQLLPVEDHETGKELGRAFKKQGIKSYLNSTVKQVDSTSKGLEIVIEDKQEDRNTLEAEIALLAIGVVGNVENLGLEEIGIKLERNQIQVDQWYQTNVSGIFAIGDVIGPPYLAHVASHEGITCVEKFSGLSPHPVDYLNIPGCTYCQPQVASVGLTEKKAKELGHELKIGKFPFRVLGKARATNSTEGFVKLIFDAQYGELLGAHIIGEEATEMIAELGTAKTLETTYLEILKTVHAHPTLSEAVMEAAGAAYGEQIHL